MIEVKGLTIAYGQHVACSDVSLQVGTGEIVVILGANGAGKSSLLKAIAGVCEGHVEGSVSLSGQRLNGLPPNDIVNQGLALVPENRGIFANLSVKENLRLGAYTERARERETANLALVHELFPKLVERSDQIVRTMSGGEQQMVAIGRAMMSAPSILMLDEPSLGLSPLLSKDLFSRLSAIKEAGIGILLVEQNAKGSLAIADRGYVLENGAITLEASAEDLRNDRSVQQAYLGAAGSKHSGGSAAETMAVVAPGTPRPTRPGAEDPASIAQAALSQFSAAPPKPKTTPHASEPVADPALPPPAQPTYVAPSPPPAPQPIQSSSTAPSIADLVAKAERQSASRRRTERPPSPMTVSSRTPPHPQAAPPAASPPSTRSPAPTSRPSNSADRLQQMLEEIEQSAQRARQRTSFGRKDR